MPTSPGIYWFLDSDDNILYVGKSSNLRSRLRQYTKISSRHPKTYKLVTTANRIKYQQLTSAIQALIVEANLISAHQPPYNIISKDDKSTLYIAITPDPYPTILLLRKKQLLTEFPHLKSSHIFGPFSSSRSARQVLQASRTIFKFCQHPGNQQHQPCFYTHINLCAGACTGHVSAIDYNHTISQLKLFLSGRKKRLLTTLKHRMAIYSNQHQYEQAATVRDQIQALQNLYSLRDHAPFVNLPQLESDLKKDALIQTQHFLHQIGLISSHHPLHRLEAYDISNTSGQYSTASMVVFFNGTPHKASYRRFRIKYTTRGGDPAMIAEVLTRRFRHPEWTFPDLVIIDGGKTQLQAALSVVPPEIPTLSLVKHPDRILIIRHNQYYYHTLKTHNHVSHLIQHIRNESHRYAKSYHAFLRRQSQLNHHLP